jgi:hypothetical protein
LNRSQKSNVFLNHGYYCFKFCLRIEIFKNFAGRFSPLFLSGEGFPAEHFAPAWRRTLEDLLSRVSFPPEGGSGGQRRKVRLLKGGAHFSWNTSKIHETYALAE